MDGNALKWICAPVLFLTACASTPREAQEKIKSENLAGYWATYKLSFDKRKPREIDSFVRIYCDGRINYELKDGVNWILPRDPDEGVIKEIENGQIRYKSWSGLTRSKSYKPPVKNKKGCWEFTFERKQLTAAAPTDCTLPEKSALEQFNEALNAATNPTKNECE